MVPIILIRCDVPYVQNKSSFFMMSSDCGFYLFFFFLHHCISIGKNDQILRSYYLMKINRRVTEND